MKLKSKKFLCVTLAVSMLSGTTAFAKIPSSEEWKQNMEIQNFIGLTNEQMVSDYEFLWKELRENYPYFGVAKRMGIDEKIVYEKYKEKVKECKKDKDFFRILVNAMTEFKGLGHLSTLYWNDVEYARNIYTSISMQSEEMEKHYKPWLETLNSQTVIKNYALYNTIFNPPELMAIINAEAEKNETTVANQEYNPIETKILEKDKIAYLKIDSFDYNLIDKSGSIITDFYKEINNYENLIIDITENGGGATDFWNKLLVAPNITEPIINTTYILHKLGDNNKKYINGFNDITKLPSIDKLPEFKNINKEDLKIFDTFFKSDDEIKPLGKEKAFKGKIWLLVSPNVYSSAEGFAVFCKNTSFATIVGTPTGGDGIGSDPELISLPNSGLIVRYSGSYGINSDGTGNEEFGTTPDIISPDGETALDTCLKEIAKRK